MSRHLYTVTLCDPDGTLVAIIPDVPGLPRVLQVTPATIQFGDAAEIIDVDDDPLVFVRIASSVWVDDERSALFVRVVEP